MACAWSATRCGGEILRCQLPDCASRDATGGRGRRAGAVVVICGAGAMTIAELAAAGVAAILVPFPHAADDHQTANARYLEARDAAVPLPAPEIHAPLP